jgi:hypothetical protein
MSELGELLELLYGARTRFRTSRGTLRTRQSHDVETLLALAASLRPVE